MESVFESTKNNQYPAVPAEPATWTNRIVMCYKFGQFVGLFFFKTFILFLYAYKNRYTEILYILPLRRKEIFCIFLIGIVYWLILNFSFSVLFY